MSHLRADEDTTGGSALPPAKRQCHRPLTPGRPWALAANAAGCHPQAEPVAATTMELDADDDVWTGLRRRLETHAAMVALAASTTDPGAGASLAARGAAAHVFWQLWDAEVGPRLLGPLDRADAAAVVTRRLVALAGVLRRWVSPTPVPLWEDARRRYEGAVLRAVVQRIEELTADGAPCARSSVELLVVNMCAVARNYPQIND